MIKKIPTTRHTANMNQELVRKQQSTVDERLQTKGFLQWPYYLRLKHFFMTGGETKTHRITRDPAVIQFKWGSGLGAFFFFFFSSFFPASCDLLFSKTHSMLISPCTSGTFCLPQLSCLCQSRPQPCYSPEKHNKLSERQTRESRRGDRLNISPLSCVFFSPLSPSIPLGVTVIAASR